MKNTLLITASVAALVAGIGLASAQGSNERRDTPAGAASGQKAPVGQSGEQKSALPQKTDKMKPAPTAQAPAKPLPGAQVQVQEKEKAQPLPGVQVQEKAKPIPTVHGQEKANKIPTAQTPATTESGRQSVGQVPSQGAPGAAAQKGSGQKGSDSFASKPMSAEENVKFRETLKGEKAEHLNNVKFSISIGDAVPRSVHFYRLPARIVEYAPQYRDFDYILVGDDILIVDPRTHRIVAVISA
jgi:hypothetical protein